MKQVLGIENLRFAPHLHVHPFFVCKLLMSEVSGPILQKTKLWKPTTLKNGKAVVGLLLRILL